MYKFVLLGMCLFCTCFSIAYAKDITRQEYINTWKEEAVYQMAAHGIPASITLSQGILESRDGNSRLAVEGSNHFGIKCHADWEGRRIYEDDDKRNECFRHYKNARESFDDHSDFLKKPRYASLFELDQADYKGWARGLKECGYATSPEYAKSLIRIVEENNLQQYDVQGLAYAKRNEVPQRDASFPSARIEASEDRKQNRKRKAELQEQRQEITLAANHEVKVSDNRIKYIVAKEGDTRESIAREIDLNILILNRFNDFDNNTIIKTGDVVYLQPKRMKSSVSECIAESGDTWGSISQKFGVKLKQLCRLNASSPDKFVEPGSKIVMKKGE